MSDRIEYQCLYHFDLIVTIGVTSTIGMPYDEAEVSIFPRTKCGGKSVILSWPFDSLCCLEDISPRVCLN